MNEKEQLEKWRWACRQMHKLIKLNAPDGVKAQLLFHILLPRMVEITNTEKWAGDFIAQLITNGLCMRSGKCLQCRTAYQSDDVLNLCPKCAAAFDQWEARIMEENPE